MKQIYFKTDPRPSFWLRSRKAMTRFATGASMQLFPRRTTRWAERILCAASRSKRNLLPLDFVISELEIHHHKINVVSDVVEFVNAHSHRSPRLH